MEQRIFGKNFFSVSALGFGAGHIGGTNMTEDEVGTLINRAVDLGVTLIDTARGYNLSEERIGRHLSWRRKDFILSTKVGYGIDGFQDWTYDCVCAGIEAALRNMQTDYIDIVHLHSCSQEILERGEVISALEKAKTEGKIRALAYSGENDALLFAINSNRFDSIETSINICDQRGLNRQIKIAQEKNFGVIAKRPIANAPWRFIDRPHGNYAEEYWHRWKTMALNNFGMEWQELAIRFTAFLPGVHSSIIGTSNIQHLHYNVELVEKGPLPKEISEHIHNAFQKYDEQWIGQV